MTKKKHENIRTGAIYVRVSTDKQDELSPDAQVRLCQEYAAKNKILVLPDHIYKEHGISGKKADKRPSFLRMIANAKSKERPFDVIILWKFSRFARNQEEAIVYKSLLRKESNVDVISISEPLVDGPFGSLNERIIEWMDEYYSINLATEVKRGMEEKALRGGYQMSPCLGYAAVGNGKAHKIVEDEYKIYEYICDQFDYNHKDPTAIAREVNALGFRTKRGNLFEARTIKYILKNPFYAGEINWSNHVYQGSHEIRMDRARFDKRIARINSIYRTKNQRNISCCRHWLGGIIKCPICGSSLGFNNSSQPGTPPFFQCWKYGKGYHKESVSLSEKKLVNSILQNFDNILNHKQDFSFRYIPPNIPNDSDLQLLHKKIDRLTIREQRIKLAYENEIDTLEEYKENKIRLNKEREELQTKINLFELSLEPSKDVVLEQIKSVYDVIRDPNVDYSIKGEFMRSVVEKIIFDKKNQRLIFYFYFSYSL